eukprot:1179572-Prorocentrum_minimum.AAC.1
MAKGFIGNLHHVSFRSESSSCNTSFPSSIPTFGTDVSRIIQRQRSFSGLKSPRTWFPPPPSTAAHSHTCGSGPLAHWPGAPSRFPAGLCCISLLCCISPFCCISPPSGWPAGESHDTVLDGPTPSCGIPAWAWSAGLTSRCPPATGLPGWRSSSCGHVSGGFAQPAAAAVALRQLTRQLPQLRAARVPLAQHAQRHVATVPRRWRARACRGAGASGAVAVRQRHVPEGQQGGVKGTPPLRRRRMRCQRQQLVRPTPGGPRPLLLKRPRPRRRLAHGGQLRGLVEDAPYARVYPCVRLQAAYQVRARAPRGVVIAIAQRGELTVPAHGHEVGGGNAEGKAVRARPAALLPELQAHTHTH